MPLPKDDQSAKELWDKVSPELVGMAKNYFATPNKIGSGEQHDKLISDVLAPQGLDGRNAELTLALLGQFGLQEEKEVKAFLTSPAGETVIGELLKELVVKEEQLEQAAQAQEQEDLLKKLIQVAFFIWIQEKEDEAEQQQRLQEVEKVLADLNKPQAQSSQSTMPPATSENNFSPYQEELDNLSSQYEELVTEHGQLQKEKTALTEKYNLYEQSVAGVHRAFCAIDNQGTTPADETKLQELEAALKAKLQDQTERFMQAVEKGQDSTAAKHAAIATNLELAVVHDILEVQKGTKYYAKEDGEITTQRAEAKFILKKGESVVKGQNEDKYYLLQKGQKFETLSTVEKEAAQNRFEQEKTQIMSVQGVVGHNKEIEISENVDKITQNEHKQKTTSAKIAELKSKSNTASMETLPGTQVSWGNLKTPVLNQDDAKQGEGDIEMIQIVDAKSHGPKT